MHSLTSLLLSYCKWNLDFGVTVYQITREINSSVPEENGGDGCSVDVCLRRSFLICWKFFWLFSRHLHNNQIQSMGARCFEGLHSLETLWVSHTRTDHNTRAPTHWHTHTNSLARTLKWFNVIGPSEYLFSQTLVQASISSISIIEH